MIRINIVGDFFSSSLSGLQFGNHLKCRLRDGDANVINLEGPIRGVEGTPIIKSGPNIIQDVNVTEFLKRKGFNIFSLANNHSMDYGEGALRNTINSLSDVLVLGAGTFKDAYSLKVFEIENKRIGFLAVTQYEFGVLDDDTDIHKIGTAWMSHPCVDEKIVDAKKYCDFLVVLPHAGLEYFSLPLPEVRTLYRHFVTMGADAVIATHPHVPQPWEIYRNKPIAYSLGNFCFDEESNMPLWNIGLMAFLQISDSGKVCMKILQLHFDRKNRIVELHDNPSINSQLHADMQTFNDEKLYMRIVNEHCISMESHYKMLLELSGYNIFTVRHCLGYLKRRILNKVFVTNDSHFINCVRCETHRWVLSRIFELKNNQI